MQVPQILWRNENDDVLGQSDLIKHAFLFSCDELLLVVDEANLLEAFNAIKAHASTSLPPVARDLLDIEVFQLFMKPYGDLLSKGRRHHFRAQNDGNQSNLLQTQRQYYENYANLSDSESEDLPTKPDDSYFVRLNPLNPRDWKLKHLNKNQIRPAMVELATAANQTNLNDIRDVLTMK